MKEMTYGEALEELERIVETLRDGQLELEKVQSMVERANALLKHCDALLRNLCETLPDKNAN